MLAHQGTPKRHFLISFSLNVNQENSKARIKVKIKYNPKIKIDTNGLTVKFEVFTCMNKQSLSWRRARVTSCFLVDIKQLPGEKFILL
jgi:hypothetical protein